MAATEYVVGVYQGSLYDFYNAGVVGAPTALTGGSSRFASGTNLVGMALVDHTLYAGDGTDYNVRFNGLNVKKSGSAKPTSVPTATESGSAGNIADGVVQYAVTYLDADGHESEPSAASTAITLTGGGSQVDLTAIPDDTDTDRIGKNVYRLGPTSAEFRLVNSLPLAADATTYTDNVDDDDLGAILIEGNTLFPPVARLWEHDDRLCGVGNSTDPRVLFVSNQFEPWYCPASPDLTDPLQGVRFKAQARHANWIGGISHGGYNFCFTDEGGYILQGVGASDYRLERFTNHGCTSHYTIKSVRHWLFWLGPDGVYRWDGAEVERVDDSIRTYITARSASDLSLATAWVYDNRYYLSFPTATDGVKCFDTRHPVADGWTTLDYPDQWLVADTSQSVGSAAGTQRVFVANEAVGRAMQVEKASTFDDLSAAGSTTNIPIEWRSKLFNMGLHARDKRIYTWGFKVRNPVSISGGSTSDVTGSLHLAGGTSAVQSATMPLSVTDPGDDWAVTPAGGRVQVERNEAVDTAIGEVFQLRIAHSAGSNRVSDFRLLEAEALWRLAN